MTKFNANETISASAFAKLMFGSEQPKKAFPVLKKAGITPVLVNVTKNRRYTFYNKNEIAAAFPDLFAPKRKPVAAPQPIEPQVEDNLAASLHALMKLLMDIKSLQQQQLLDAFTSPQRTA